MSMEMDMAGDMADCPFMSHEKTLCSMNFIDHIGAWKFAFISIVPTLTLLLSVVVIMVAIVSVAPNLLQKRQYAPPRTYRWILQRIYTFSYRSLQELFSNGILHPKLFGFIS